MATSYTVYKKSAALRVSIQKASENDRGFTDSGGFFLLFAPAANSGDRKYSWEKPHSVTVFISADEVAKFLRMIEKDHSIRFYHDPDKGTPQEGTRSKTLSSSPGNNGTVLLTATSGESRVTVPLDVDEIATIATLMRTSLRECYGW